MPAKPLDPKILDPDFDLNSFKKTELEELLTNHDVHYMKRMNKAELSKLIRQFIIDPEVKRIKKQEEKEKEKKEAKHVKKVSKSESKDNEIDERKKSSSKSDKKKKDLTQKDAENSILPSKRPIDDVLPHTSTKKKSSKRKQDVSMTSEDESSQALSSPEPKKAKKSSTESKSPFQKHLKPQVQETKAESSPGVNLKHKVETTRNAETPEDLNNLLKYLSSAPLDAETKRKQEKYKRMAVVSPSHESTPEKKTVKNIPLSKEMFSGPLIDKNPLIDYPEEVKATTPEPVEKEKEDEEKSKIFSSNPNNFTSKKIDIFNVPSGPKTKIDLDLTDVREESTDFDESQNNEQDEQDEQDEENEENEEEESAENISVHSEVNPKETISTPSISEDEQVVEKEQEKLKEAIAHENEFEDDEVTQDLTQDVTQEMPQEYDIIPIGRFLSYLSIWLFVLLFGYSIIIYREKRIEVGFCGSEVIIPIFPNLNSEHALSEKINPFIDDVNEFLTPSCVECPPHGSCYQYSKLVCDPDYIINDPWYSVFGLIPTYSNCKLDSAKLETLSKIFKITTTILRYKNADVKCGRGSTEDAGIKVEHLKGVLLNSAYVKSKMSTIDFDTTWARVYSKLREMPEIEIQEAYDSDSLDFDNFIIRSTSLMKLNFRCKLENLITSIFDKFRHYLIIASLICGLVFSLQKYYLSYRKEKKFVTSLSEEIISKLRTQCKDSKLDKFQQTPSYLSSIQLRDFYLRNSDYSNDEKNRLWSKISKILEVNSNVKIQNIEVHGEIMKVWEWISDF